MTLIPHGLNIPVPEPNSDEEAIKNGIDVLKKSSKDDTWPYPEKRFDWPKPYALTWSGWRRWKREMKELYPVRYFLHEDVSDWWRSVWTWGVVERIKNVYWWVMHRVHPKHRYHVIDTGLKPGYYDPDSLMLDGCFTILSKFVEHQKEYDIIDWNGDPGHQEAWKEMCDLYDWYKNERPIREIEFQKRRPEPANRGGDIWDELWDDEAETPEKAAYKEYLSEFNQKEVEWAQEDEDNFIRLIKLRQYLWYA